MVTEGAERSTEKGGRVGRYQHDIGLRHPSHVKAAGLVGGRSAELQPGQLVRPIADDDLGLDVLEAVGIKIGQRAVGDELRHPYGGQGLHQLVQAVAVRPGHERLGEPPGAVRRIAHRLEGRLAAQLQPVKGDAAQVHQAAVAPVVGGARQPVQQCVVGGEHAVTADRLEIKLVPERRAGAELENQRPRLGFQLQRDGRVIQPERSPRIRSGSAELRTGNPRTRPQLGEGIEQGIHGLSLGGVGDRQAQHPVFVGALDPHDAVAAEKLHGRHLFGGHRQKTDLRAVGPGDGDAGTPLDDIQVAAQTERHEQQEPGNARIHRKQTGRAAVHRPLAAPPWSSTWFIRVFMRLRRAGDTRLPSRTAARCRAAPRSGASAAVRAAVPRAAPAIR